MGSRTLQLPAGARLRATRIAGLALLVAGLSVALWAATHAAEAAPPVAASNDANASKTDQSTKTDAASKALPASAATFGIPQVAYINQFVRNGWQEHQLAPSPPATEGEWCRRVYLDILGRIPRVAELDAFVKDYATDKKVRLVDRLLSAEYGEEYAANWTTLWTNVLIGRSGGTERNSRTNRDGMQQYLHGVLSANKPYDQMVRELISATGTSKPGVEGFNGAVNFLAMKLEDKGIQAAAQTSQIFLGVRVQCTQCHDHPFNTWQQNQFWQVNAFFRQTAALRKFNGGQNIAYIELVDQDYAGEGGDVDEAELYYEQRNGLMKVAYPVFTDADGSTTELEKSGYVNKVNRRSELAKLVVNSQYMPRAIVNRMWGHFLGYGFSKPLDDMGPHNPPSHPELLDKLSSDFKAAGFDLKKLIRWIVLSEAYGLSSRAIAENRTDDPALGEKPMFSHFYMRQMRPEELYGSLITATVADVAKEGAAKEGTAKLDAVKQDAVKPDAVKLEAAKQEAARRDWLKQFTIAFGTDDNEETTTFNGTIPQTLMMFNGDMMKRATSGQKGTLLERVAADPKLSIPQKMDTLFRAALARPATSQERNNISRILRGRKDVPEALGDVWWALLNSNEFILNH